MQSFSKIGTIVSVLVLLFFIVLFFNIRMSDFAAEAKQN